MIVIGGGQRSFLNPLQPMAMESSLMGQTRFERHDQHRQIGEIAGQVVPEQRMVGNIQELNHRSSTALSGRLWFFT
jgi:hypothetical protein